VRARATTTSAATRREVEQSIARFEKRLDDANDALQTLGKHLGRGAQSSYKEVTTALRALRRDAVKTNKQALKDFDKLRQALTQASASASSSSSSRSSRSTRSSSGGTRSTSRSTASRSSGSRSSGSRSSGSRATGSSRSTSARSTSSRSSGSRPTGSRSRSTSSRAKKS
jgi:DNA topoisomerase-1